MKNSLPGITHFQSVMQNTFEQEEKVEKFSSEISSSSTFVPTKVFKSVTPNESGIISMNMRRKYHYINEK